MSERIPLRRRQEELCAIFGKATQERAFTANELAHFARLTLGETKGALRGLVNGGTVRKRTNPSKPTSNLYFRGWRDAEAHSTPAHEGLEAPAQQGHRDPSFGRPDGGGEELMARGLSSFGGEPRYWKDRNGQIWAVCIECDAAIKAEHAFWLPSDKAVRDVPACRDCALRAIEAVARGN